jgi:hypothetical protein
MVCTVATVLQAAQLIAAITELRFAQQSGYKNA